MTAFERVFLEAIKGDDKFHIVSGPLQAGKTTLCRKLAQRYSVPLAYEFHQGKRPGVDVTEDGWWRQLMAYGANKGTNVIETHLRVHNVLPWDKSWKAQPVISDIKQPPAMVQMYFVIPKDYQEYNRRNEGLLPSGQMVKVYDYYKSLSEQFPTAIIAK